MKEPNASGTPSERELFFEALGKTSKKARADFLDGACFNQPEMRRRIEELLASHSVHDSFLQEAAIDPGVTLRVEPPLTEGPGTKIGRYKLLQQIGEGGMGVVYMAEQQEPVRRRVALKIIKLGMDTRQVVARFEAERQALAMMDHPNIAKVLDGGTTETGRPFFVMELVQGVPIVEFCDKSKLSTGERLKLFIQVCHAVQSAHQKGVIHRDLKPSNILVTSHHGEPMPKVIDFGIAKAINQKLTEKTIFTCHAAMIGTPAYMSPEQAEFSSMDVDTRTDIYSLGVLLYELLTGSTPFPEKRLRSLGYGEMQRVIVEEEPERPSTRLSTLAHDQKSLVAGRRGKDVAELGRQLRGDLDWVIMRCLEKDRRRRYESASGLSADIQRHLANEPVLARPPSAVYRLQKAWRRNKLACSAGLAVAASLILGLAISSWQARAAIRARALANEQKLAAQEESRKAREAEAREAAERKRAVANEQDSRLRAYASDIHLAKQSLDDGKLGAALELLSQPDMKNQQGWEWRYLWQQTRSEALARFCRSEHSVKQLAASPDGRWLAVMERGGKLRLWDVSTRRPAAELAAADHVRPAFAPKRNLLAYLERATSRVRLWDPSTEQEVAGFPATWCRGIAFSADAKFLVILSDINRIDPETRHVSAIRCEVTRWQLSDGRKISSFSCEEPPLYDQDGVPLAISPDARLAAIGGYSGGVIVANLETGVELWRAGNSGFSLAFSPDGNTLAAGSSVFPHEIALHDAATGTVRQRLTGHRSGITSLAFLPDGRQLASASLDQSVRVWDLQDPARMPPPRVFRGHTAEVWTMALMGDGRTLASAGKEGGVNLWDSRSARHESFALLQDSPVGASWCLASPGTKVVGVHLQKQELLEWQGPGHSLQRAPIVFNEGARRACWSGDGRLLAIGSTNGIVQIWDAATRSLVGQISAGNSAVSPLRFDRENRQLALIAETAYEVWSVQTASRISSHELPAACRPVRSGYAFFEPEVSADLAQVPLLRLLRGGDMAVVLWQPATDSRVDLQQFFLSATDRSSINALRFSPDGRLLAIIKGSTAIFDTQSGQQVAALSAFYTEGGAADFSPDGQRFAISGDDGVVQLYHTRTWRLLMTLSSGCNWIGSLRFSTDADSIRVRGADIIGRDTVERILCWRVPSLEDIDVAEKRMQLENQTASSNRVGQ